MAKLKPKKVFTPGSQPSKNNRKDRPKKQTQRGRPSKKNANDTERYQRYTNYRTKYDLSALNDAIAAVENGMPVKTAAREFAVPKSMLQARIKGQHGDKLGGLRKHSSEEESSMQKW